MSKTIIVVGGKGTGKTTFVKERIKNVPKNLLLIHDPNKEYTEFYNEPFLSANEFVNKASKTTNTVIVLEEATIFFSNRGNDQKLTEILVRTRHTNNTVFLNFHSLRAVPRYIYDLCNYIVVHKTNDSEKLVESKFTDQNLTDIFLEARNSPNLHYEKIYEIY